MINVKRDYNRKLQDQIREYTAKGYKYIGCFGRTGNAVLKFYK